MHALHIGTHLQRAAALATVLALVITLAFLAAAERLGAGSESTAPPSPAPITATPPLVDAPAWVNDPLSPPNIMLAG